MQKKVNTAVVVAAHDGLQSVLTGVGVIVQSFFESFEDQKKKIRKLNNHSLSLYALAPYIDKTSSDFNNMIRKSTQEVCRRNGGDLIEIPTLSDGSSQQSIWGGPGQWRASSISAASTINFLAKGYDKVYVFGHDTVFSLIGNYLDLKKNVKFVWIPHSLGKIFQDEHSADERIAMELESVRSINKNKNHFIGYIGKSFKEVLISKYGAKKRVMIPFINGIYEKSFRYNLSSTEVRCFEKKYHFPRNKKIVFAWGRLVKQKGYDLLIPEFKKLHDFDNNFHLILLAPIETSIKSYLSEFKRILRLLPSKSYTLIETFESKLPFYVLNFLKPHILVFPSRFEGNPVIGLESLVFNKDAKIVYSSIPPLIELFKGKDNTLPFLIGKDNLSDVLLKDAIKTCKKESPTCSFVENYLTGWKYLVG